MKLSPALRGRFRTAALLLLGFMCGLAMSVVVCGRRVERAAMESRRLGTALAEAQRDLVRLGENLVEARRAVIDEIGLALTGEAKEDHEELRGALRRKLEVLIGKEPAALEPEVVAEMISGVKLRFQDREYRADPVLIVLARKCFFRIVVKRIDAAGAKE